MRASAPLPRRRKTTREMDGAGRITTATRGPALTAATRADITTVVLHSNIARRRHNGRHRVRHRSAPARLHVGRPLRPRITARGSRIGVKEERWGQPPSAVRRAQPGLGSDLIAIRSSGIGSNLLKACGASLRGQPTGAVPTFSCSHILDGWLDIRNPAQGPDAAGVLWQ